MGLLLLLVGYFLGLYFFGSGIGGLIIALLVWGVMSLVAFFRGGNILLTLSRAKKISRDDHPRLYNVVEEMKIASGLEKMPDIYIIDDPALNAFATGRDPNRAAVAITSGLLQKLNRDQLQGVIAHEISHIKNRDVLLMAMSSVLLGTIVILASNAGLKCWLSIGCNVSLIKLDLPLPETPVIQINIPSGNSISRACSRRATTLAAIATRPPSDS